MVVEILGFTICDYTSKRDGHAVKGANLFMLEPISHSGSGFRYVGFFDKGSYKPYFLSDSVYPSSQLKCGKYDVQTSLSGAITSFTPIKD